VPIPTNILDNILSIAKRLESARLQVSRIGIYSRESSIYKEEQFQLLATSSRRRSRKRNNKFSLENTPKRRILVDKDVNKGVALTFLLTFIRGRKR
jgi:hypothetical protein